MNWYEEKKLYEESEKRIQEIKEKNPELYEKWKKAFEYANEQLKGIDKYLANK